VTASGVLATGLGQAGLGRPVHRVVLLACGLTAFAVGLALYLRYDLTHPMSLWMDAVDLREYRVGGEVAMHARPWYNPRLASPLYDSAGIIGLKFTYPHSPRWSSRC
jgi:hypothetical protein